MNGLVMFFVSVVGLPASSSTRVARERVMKFVGDPAT